MAGFPLFEFSRYFQGKSHKIIAILVIQGDMKMRGGDDLRGLGVDQFEHIVKGKGHVHTLRDAGKRVHFQNSALKMGNRLHPFDGNGGLVADIFKESQVTRGIGMAG